MISYCNVICSVFCHLFSVCSSWKYVHHFSSVFWSSPGSPVQLIQKSRPGFPQATCKRSRAKRAIKIMSRKSDPSGLTCDHMWPFIAFVLMSYQIFEVINWIKLIHFGVSPYPCDKLWTVALSLFSPISTMLSLSRIRDCLDVKIGSS